MFSLLRTSLLSRTSLNISRLGSIRALHLNKDGSPDKRFLENKHLKLEKDGTPDLRFKPAVRAEHPPAHGRPLRLDGSPDLRFNPTFRSYSAKNHGGLTKSGKPDMRLKINQSASTETKKSGEEKA